jgi:hypothetical protein
MAEPRTAISQGPTPRPDVSDVEATEAWLLATFPSERTAWNDYQVFCVNNFRKFSVFFCPSMMALTRRGKTMERICKKHLPDHVGRRYLNSLSAGQAITLDKIISVHRVLEAIAASKIPEVRNVTLVARAGKASSFRLMENSVVPSHLWVDRSLLRQFRTHFQFSAAELGRLLFDKAAYADSIIERLEEGEISEGGLHDYRVTPFTSDHIHAGLRAVFDANLHAAKDDFPALPSEAKFFIASHTAGEGSGRRTKPLGIPNGNLLAPSSAATRSLMFERIKKHGRTRRRVY